MVIPNDTPEPYTFAFSQVEPVQKPGGTVKIADSRSFKVSDKIAVAEVVVEVDGIRCVVNHLSNRCRFANMFRIQ